MIPKIIIALVLFGAAAVCLGKRRDPYIPANAKAVFIWGGWIAPVLAVLVLLL